MIAPESERMGRSDPPTPGAGALLPSGRAVVGLTTVSGTLAGRLEPRRSRLENKWRHLEWRRHRAMNSAALRRAAPPEDCYFFFAFDWGFSSMAACAAARRAIGTRNGEQLT